jgi:hypothetical protein
MKLGSITHFTNIASLPAAFSIVGNLPENRFN